jgi:hypothetical protein
MGPGSNTPTKSKPLRTHVPSQAKIVNGDLVDIKTLQAINRDSKSESPALGVRGFLLGKRG